jgi:hypothetical protein
MTRPTPDWRRKYAHHAPIVPPPTTTASAVSLRPGWAVVLVPFAVASW